MSLNRVRINKSATNYVKGILNVFVRLSSGMCLYSNRNVLPFHRNFLPPSLAQMVVAAVPSVTSVDKCHTPQCQIPEKVTFIVSTVRTIPKRDYFVSSLYRAVKDEIIFTYRGKHFCNY